jgi:hypothetical protein
MEKRKHPRIKINNLCIDILDGADPFKGSVSNISLSGMRINDVSNRLNLESKQLSVVFSENKKLFRMNVSPQWYLKDKDNISMGVKILNSPWTWTDFIIKHEMMSMIA